MPPLTDSIARILAALPSDQERHFLALTEAIYRAKYTGQIVVHFKNGEPRQVDLGAPVKLSICQPLDSREDSRAGS